MAEVEKWLGDKSYYCGVGIAYGEVTGYFPTIGVKQYDIYGDAIVHATRYETMRKHLFENGLEMGHIIIMQDKAYEQLSDKFKAEMKWFDLRGYKVRDDEDASGLYYKLIKWESKQLDLVSWLLRQRK